MKASKLIEYLQKAVEQSGDLEIEVSVGDHYSVGGHDAEILSQFPIETCAGIQQFRLVCSLYSREEYSTTGTVLRHPDITFKR